jgi:hypothetical protein
VVVTASLLDRRGEGSAAEGTGASAASDDRQRPEQHGDACGQADRRIAEPIDDGEEHDRQAEHEDGGGQTAH